MPEPAGAAAHLRRCRTGRPPELREAALGATPVRHPDRCAARRRARRPAWPATIASTADAAPGAMVALALDAPCAPGERFTLHHNGMMFTEVTDEGGHASMLVPALTRKRVFIAAFANGEGAVANAEVASLGVLSPRRGPVAGRHRYAASRAGIRRGLRQRRRMSGPERARDMAAAATANSGFHDPLGRRRQPDALMAEIYTFPSRSRSRDGDVALTRRGRGDDGQLRPRHRGAGPADARRAAGCRCRT